MSKTVQSGQFLNKALGNLGKKKKALLNLLLLLKVLPKLTTKEILSVLEKFESKISEKGVERKRIHFTYFERKYGWYP